MKKLIPYIVILILGFFLYNKLTEEPKVVTNTKIEWKTKIDTFYAATIDKTPKVKHVKKKKTAKGKDSIVYVYKEDSTTIKANEYKTQLKSNNAVADLKVLTTGELLDVTGVIKYDQKETVTTITKTYNKSGTFLYGETTLPPGPPSFKVGLDYVIKNKYIIGASYGYDSGTKDLHWGIKVGIKIF